MKKRHWYRRMNVQLVAFLTLALFPLGSIAIFQTYRVSVEADQNVEAAFLGLTEQAARHEQVLIERAVGAARLFGSIVPALLQNPDGCAPFLSRFVEANAEFSFVGVLPISGVVTCSSSERIIDFSDYPDFDAAIAAQQPTIVVNEAPPISGQSAFVVSEPFQIDGAFAGFISVSIPHSQLPETDENLDDLGLKELIMFNEDGMILTARSNLTDAQAELPRGLDLAGLPTNEPQIFRTENRDGVERRYSVVSVQGSPAAVMAIWTTDAGSPGRLSGLVAPITFPVLMWFASMGVAMLAMNTLVLRHLRRLRKSMDDFADTRRATFDQDAHALMALEIDDLESNFQRMSEEIMRDEATLENTVREKDVLVKEIHHRVKNNLQLISSIMNMQIRAAEHAETQQVLRRVQERVLSLATIHRDLYQSQDAGRVNVGALVIEIVENSVDLAIADGGDIIVDTEIDPILLYPDQAVPLSLLVSEAATNAMKFIGDTSHGKPSVTVRLKQDGTACLLVFTNSIGEVPNAQSTGLGSKLMNAFALQLGGKIHVEQTDESYSLTVNFNVLKFQPEARDF